MKKIIYLLVCLLFSLLVQAQNFKIANGNVWNGEAFIKKDLYVSYGTFTDALPSPIDSVIDASNQYIVPPFGDYHTHFFDGDYAIQADSIFLAQGLFYAQDLVNDPLGRKKMTSFLNRKNTVDVAFANACLTSNYGHPIAAYERMALGINWPKNQAEKDRIRESRQYEGRTYHIVDEEYEVEKKMKLLLSTQPDLLKVILWDAEEYENLDTVPVDNQGLNPALLPAIVKMSKNYELPVVAHIETETDLDYAIKAGITRFAHAPFYSYANDGRVSENYPRLTEKILEKLSGQPQVTINPTLYRTFRNLSYLPKAYQLSEKDKKLLYGFHRQLLMDLHQNNVKLVAGADFSGLNAIDEIMYYQQLDVFSDKALLKMLIETSQAIFPRRKIGRLESGFEANLLILKANPLDDIKNIRSIVFKMKNGLVLD